MLEHTEMDKPKAGAGALEAFEEIHILGCKVHSVTMAQTMEAAKRFIESGKAHYIVTADSSGIVNAQEDDEFRRIINSADLVTPDSMGILIGARLVGTPVPERVSGVDIAHDLCEMAAEEGFGVYLLGAAPGVAEEAADKLKAKFPGLKIAGTHHGYFSTEEEPEVIEQIAKSGARVLFVAMGIPKQEKLIVAHLDRLNVGVAMGVGGSLDVLSGRIDRAPIWMRKHGLEWLYRLSQDPKKIHKVAVLPKFLAMALREKWFGGKSYV